MSWIRVSGILALVVAGLLSPCSRAQVVTLVPVDWRDKSDPPDQLPVLQGAAPVEFPEGMKASDQIGYVISEVMLDESGKVLEEVRHATSDACLDAVRQAERNTKWLPGRRDGKSVVTAITYAYIFNPASAGSNQADATPRLLEVDVGYRPVKATVVNPPASDSKASGAEVKEETGVDGGRKPAVPTPTDLLDTVVVKAEITVGLNGKISAVDAVPDEFVRAVKIAAKNWRFAPARQKGEPVVAKIPADFVLVGRDGEDGSKKPDILAQVLKTFPPVFPLALRMKRMRGEVVVGITINIEGRASSVGIVRSSNPLFDENTIEAVKKWRFQPAMKDGKPVVSRMKVPIVFSVPEEEGGGSGPFITKKKGDLSKVPEAFRYDTPPVPINFLPPVYPYALLREGVKGRAMVGYIVNEKGVVVRTEIKEASSPEFGAALVAAIEGFRFRPALKNGVPCLAMMLHEEKFEGDGLAQLVGTKGRELLRREKRKPESFPGADELDDEPRPAFTKPPAFPLNAKSTTGYAEIDFILDETGRVRLPRIVSATEDVFGYAAVQAASTWRFDPPRVGGKPAAVRVRVPFNFTPTKKRN